ncbi:hypothetical protein J7L68_06770 [bacterium]|nr:hypothetical protein [bacterium]
MKSYTIIIFMLLLGVCVAQDINAKIYDVLDAEFKLSQKEERIFYFQFARGDTIIINAKTIKGKEISKFYVSQYPSTILYEITDVPSIQDRKIAVADTAIFKFFIYNGSFWKSRKYKLQIQRKPCLPESITFNTTIAWDTLYDTTWTTKIETTSVTAETTLVELINTSQKVGGSLGSSNTRVSVDFTLPKGTVSWSYWIGSGDEAKKQLDEMGKALPKAATVLGIVNPVAAFAIEVLPNLVSHTTGKDFSYSILNNYEELKKFRAGESYNGWKHGKQIVTDYARLEYPIEGKIYFAISNKGMVARIVNLNAVAVKVTTHYETRKVQVPHVKTSSVPMINR